jgi:hypothetical protein
LSLTEDGFVPYIVVSSRLKYAEEEQYSDPWSIKRRNVVSGFGVDFHAAGQRISECVTGLGSASEFGDFFIKDLDGNSVINDGCSELRR